MKSILLALALAGLSSAQVSPFPAGLDSNATLGVAADNVSSELTAPILVGDTIAQVANATRIPQWSIITFGSEQMKVCAKSGNTLTLGTPSSCPSIAGRGLSGTTIVAHSTGVIGRLNIDSYHQQAAASAIIAIEGSIPRMVSDFSYQAAGNTFYQACTAAVNAGLGLVVGSAWTGVATGACGASVTFYKGGSIQPVGGQTVTIKLQDAPLATICDTRLGGTCIFTSATGSVYPQWWGASAGAADNTAAFNAAQLSVCPNAGICTGSVVLTPGTYITLSRINLVAFGSNWSCTGGGHSCIISYRGATNASAVYVVGYNAHLSDIYIRDDGTGWLDGIQYDGIPGVLGSTKGLFDDITVDCNGNPGNGASFGRSAFQADQSTWTGSSFNNCTSGTGALILDGNSLSHTFVNALFNRNHIGISAFTSANVTLTGGEMDNNDVNLISASGTLMVISGVRSEGSKHTFFSGAGTYQQPTTFDGYLLSSHNFIRPATTITAAAGATTAALSNAGFSLGDNFTVAGETGNPVHHITSQPTLTSVGFFPVMASNVSAAALTLDASTPDVIESGAGPYVHINYDSNVTEGGTFTVANGPQSFEGCLWTMNISNPFGLTTASSPPAPGPARLYGNLYNYISGSPTPMPNTTGSNIEQLAAVNGTTVDFSQTDLVRTANTVPTCIDTLQGAIAGRTVRIWVNDSHTSFCTGGNIAYTGLAVLAVPAGSIYSFVANNTAGGWTLMAAPTVGVPLVQAAGVPNANFVASFDTNIAESVKMGQNDNLSYVFSTAPLPLEFGVNNSLAAAVTVNGGFTVGNLGVDPGAGVINAQNGYIVGGTGINPGDGPHILAGIAAPSGSCLNGSLYSNMSGTAGATLYSCVENAWVAFAAH